VFDINAINYKVMTGTNGPRTPTMSNPLIGKKPYFNKVGLV